MKKQVLRQYGIWIDHKNAIVVSIIDGVVTSEKIRSGIDSHVRFRGEGSNKTGEFGFSATREKNTEHRKAGELRKFLRQVIRKIAANADAVFIMGPADVKLELKRMLLEMKSFKETFVATETADKMTIREITDKVKEHFEMV